MTSRSLRHRAPLLWLALPLMAGLALGRMGWLPWPPALLAGGAAGLAAAALVASAWRSRGWAVPMVMAMVLAGGASYALHRAPLGPWAALPPREARLTLRVTRNFAPAMANHTGGLAEVTGTAPHLADLRGQRLYFSLSLAAGESAPLRGSEIVAVGVLQGLPADPAGGSFEEYLVNAGMNFQLTRGRLQTTSREASAYEKFCARLLARMEALLGAGLEARPEHAAELRAMMLGQKHELSGETRELFMHSGTMHLFAINGLHIGVVAVALHLLLGLLRCPRPLASLLVLGALWLDVDTTGASPSAVRAFLMLATLEMAWVVRRPANPLAALGVALAINLVIDPLDFFSASFEMSYAVVAAVLQLGLPLAERMRVRWPAFPDFPAVTWAWHHRFRAWLKRRTLDAVALGCAATLVSTVSGVEFFQVFVTGALLANLVLVPLASLVIMTGFASLVCGLAGMGWAGRLCNGLAGGLLGLIETLIREGTRLPGAYWTAHFRASWIGPLALVAVLTACLAGYATGWRRERGGFWPPFVLLAIFLLGGVKFA